MYKYMKKIIILPLFFIGMMLVMGADDCDPIQSNVSSDSRTLTCDNSKPTVTSYEYPKGTGNWVKTFNNEYCTVVCKEFISLSFEGIKKVYAGQGFSYPLFVSANRNCKSTYSNVETFDKLYRKMVDAYMVLADPKEVKADVNNDGLMDSKDIETVNSWVNTLLTLDGRKILAFPDKAAALRGEIMEMKKMKTECNEWGNTTNRYSLDSTVNLSITTSKGKEQKKYSFVETTPYANVKTEDESTSYYSCRLESPNANELLCVDEPTITGWTEIATINGAYTMPTVNLELYTGKVIANEKGEIKDGQCIAGPVYFTDFEEVTRPALNDKNDKGYPLVLTALRIGNNIDKKVPKRFNLTVNCFYQVKNVSSPTESDTVYTYHSDVITKREGFLLHEYRIIDLNNPFPGRNPLANWDGIVKVMINGKIQEIPLKEYYITEKGTSIRKNNLYTIKLNNSSVRAISRYNKSNAYGVFNLDKKENSIFVRKHNDIIKKGN